jgi:hypothetical protein
MPDMPIEHLRAVWASFRSVPFPAVEILGVPTVDALIDAILEFEARVAGHVDGLVSGVLIAPVNLVVPEELVAAIASVERTMDTDPVARTVVEYARKLVELVGEAHGIASNGNRFRS